MAQTCNELDIASLGPCSVLLRPWMFKKRIVPSGAAHYLHGSLGVSSELSGNLDAPKPCMAIQTIGGRPRTRPLRSRVHSQSQCRSMLSEQASRAAWSTAVGIFFAFKQIPSSFALFLLFERHWRLAVVQSPADIAGQHGRRLRRRCRRWHRQQSQ